ncbi:glycosyltransferase family 4 protein [Clostridium sp.]|jgi:glycosyltransferase involved in cell wall biosynthesis|uniref:glycosyltransferase family 4 protein n=1 Tax=Clostridium sp. TaxID=1506 RepID=UPI00290DC8AB|nr:glycosyltransferase family 4 protein [Clostridium sp.]MDU7363117.1 glycosyltransferase family 4 protein [Clostridium sp.]
MKKIAILATYVGEVNRGAETFVIEFVSRMKKYYDIEVFSLSSCEKINENINVVNVNEDLILKINRFLYNKFTLYRKISDKVYYLIPDVAFQKKFTKVVFKKYIRKKHYDIIFPNNGVWGAKFSNELRKYNGTPYIYTGHGGIGTGERLILKTNPNKYISLTEKHLKWAKNYSPNVIKIHNGIDIDNFLAKSDNFIKDKIVLSVGALTEFKRHELTIDALSQLDSSYKLKIVGDGELKEKIKQYALKKLGDRFELIKVPYQQINNIYKEANLFVLPSLDEPFGIVYLEAMASNLPIVAPDDDTRREIIGNAGLYCDCENAEEYSRTIVEAMNREWGTLPIKRAEIFNWDNIITNYKELIEEIINGNSKKNN